MTTTGRNPNPVNQNRTPTRTAIVSLSLAALLTLTACGGEDSDGSNDTATDPASDAGSAPSGRSGGFDTEQLEEIQACLKAAGLEDKVPTGQPSGAPSEMPSDLPTNLPSGAPSDFPSDFPSDLPSDFPTDLGSGAPGSGGAGMLQDPEVEQALEACGIDLSQEPGQN